jgi:nucleotide-binding universal stress UspA family protein
MNVTTDCLDPEPAFRGREAGYSERPPQLAEEICASAPELKLRTILAPVDFSAASEIALEYAVPIATQFGARITLLHVSQAQLGGNEFAYLPISEAAICDPLRKRLNAMASRTIPPGLLGETLVRNGLACDQIVKAACELSSDLIILNTHGYTGLKHMLIGSTAERVVRCAPCPVLVVRQRQHESVCEPLPHSSGSPSPQIG